MTVLTRSFYHIHSNKHNMRLYTIPESERAPTYISNIDFKSATLPHISLRAAQNCLHF